MEITSESVVPSIVGEQRRVDGEHELAAQLGNSLTRPLWTNSQRPWRNGWQLVSCTRCPMVARTCARNSGDSIWAASSRRLASPHAGETLR